MGGNLLNNSNRLEIWGKNDLFGKFCVDRQLSHCMLLLFCCFSCAGHDSVVFVDFVLNNVAFTV